VAAPASTSYQRRSVGEFTAGSTSVSTTFVGEEGALMALHSAVADWEGTLTRAEYYRQRQREIPAPLRTDSPLKANRERLTRSRQAFDKLREELAGTRWA